MDIFDPDKRRISVILVPPRPMMHPTMSDGIDIFCVRRFADCEGGEPACWGEPGEDGRLASLFERREVLPTVEVLR